MDISYQFLITIGGILLIGLLVSNLAQRTFLPRVTLLLVFGAVAKASKDSHKTLF